LIASFIQGMETGGLYLQLSVGWGTENFFGGFPRVFYGFTCGMLLYQLTSSPSPFRLLNWIQRAPSFHTFILYAGFVGMLLNPHLMKGLYSFGVIIVLAPLLIMQGSNAKCENRAVLATSEFLGFFMKAIIGDKAHNSAALSGRNLFWGPFPGLKPRLR
jgi:hypothetical protein